MLVFPCTEADFIQLFSLMKIQVILRGAIPNIFLASPAVANGL